jgi:hypothetical protein
MRDFVVCCHAGFVDNTPIVDLNYAEECSNCADMPVAIMPNCGDTVRAREGAEGSVDMAVDTEQQADAEAGETDGAAQPQSSGDSIVMMQLDRRLPLEHFESLGAKSPARLSHAHTDKPVLAGALCKISSDNVQGIDQPWRCCGVAVALLQLCVCTVGVAADGARQIYALLKEVCSNVALCFP